MKVKSFENATETVNKNKDVFFKKNHQKVSIVEYAELIQTDEEEREYLLTVINDTIDGSEREHHQTAVMSLRDKCMKLQQYMAPNSLVEFDQTYEKLNNYCASILQ